MGKYFDQKIGGLKAIHPSIGNWRNTGLLGMYTFVRWNYIFIAPPLCIKEAEIDEGLEIISQSLRIADRDIK